MVYSIDGINWFVLLSLNLHLSVNIPQSFVIACNRQSFLDLVGFSLIQL
jgi:1-acyl-sn-glycerol-3-phosphate acyltransferase